VAALIRRCSALAWVKCLLVWSSKSNGASNARCSGRGQAAQHTLNSIQVRGISTTRAAQFLCATLPPAVK